MLSGLQVDSVIADSDNKEVVMHTYFRSGDELTALSVLRVKREDYFELLKALKPVRSIGPTHYKLFGFHSEKEKAEILSQQEYEYKRENYLDRT